MATGSDETVLEQVRDAAAIEDIRLLFREYARLVEAQGVSLDFQGIEDELATLPGKYAPPAGGLLIARVGGAVAGGVGLRALDRWTCEMKRLYVRPAFRGRDLGRLLSTAAMDLGSAIGYRAMRLDTVPSLFPAATRLYQELGFREISPYCHNPLEGAIFLERSLDTPTEPATKAPRAR